MNSCNNFLLPKKKSYENEQKIQSTQY